MNTIKQEPMEQHFASTPHHDILALLIQVAVLLFTARALGEVAQRLNQPTVVGEILAGLVLGPSLLSGLVPPIGVWLLPQNDTQVHLLDLISMLGALFMMFLAGLEIDLLLIRRQARPAIGAGIGGLILPFLFGLALAAFIPDTLLEHPNQRLVFILFVATAISVSAIPVIAKVLIELDLTRRDMGQIMIAAAMIGDVVAWVMLSLVLSLAETATISSTTIVTALGSVVLLVVLTLTLGRWLVNRSVAIVLNESRVPDTILSLMVICMFMWAAVSHSLHLEPVIGAFVMGILFSQIRTISDRVLHSIETIALAVFAPIFFAVAGLKVDLSILFDPYLAALSLLFIIIGSIGKIAGSYAGIRLASRYHHWTALSIGVGLNARGAVEIIIASIGLSKGILSQDMFSIIVLMSIVTSLAAPGMLRSVLARVQPEAQELERLEREKLLKDNLFANVQRVLVPVRRRTDDRGGPTQAIESRILEHVAGSNQHLALTLLNVASDGDKAGSQAFLNGLARLFPHIDVTRKVVVSTDPTNAILDEARKGYDLVVVGATSQKGGTEVLFNPIVDTLVRLSPCPSIVVHGQEVAADWAPRRILVPTSGSQASRRAVQAAFSLVGSGGNGEVLILKVINYEATMCYLDAREAIMERQYIIAHQIVDELGAMGQSLGIPTYTAVQPGPDPETVIFDVAHNAHMDLIVLGTSVRAGSERLYLGSRVERILHHAPCPVIIVNAG